MKEPQIRLFTVLLGIAAVAGWIFGFDRMAALNDVRKQTGSVEVLRSVMKAQESVLVWEHLLYNPGGRSLEKMFGTLRKVIEDLAAVEGNDARYWEARAHLGMLQYDSAIEALGRCTDPISPDVRILEARVRFNDLQLAQMQLQYVMGAAHIRARRNDQLNPKRDETVKAYQAAANTPGITAHDKAVCDAMAIWLRLPVTPDKEERERLKGDLDRRVKGADFLGDGTDPMVVLLVGGTQTAVQRMSGDYVVLLNHIGTMHRNLGPESAVTAENYEDWFQTRWKPAFDLATATTNVLPGRPEAYTLRGILWNGQARRLDSFDAHRAGQCYTEAFEDFTRALKRAQELDMDTEPFATNLAAGNFHVGAYLLAMRRVAEARTRLALGVEGAAEIINEVDRDHAGALYILARADQLLAEAGDRIEIRLPQSIDVFKLVLEKGDPNDIELRLYYGLALNQRGYIRLEMGREKTVEASVEDFNLAIEVIQPLLAAEPPHRKAYDITGRAYLGKGRALSVLPEESRDGEDPEVAYEESIKKLDVNVTSTRGAPDATYVAGEARFYKGLAEAESDEKVDPVESLDDAIKHFQAVAQLVPKHALANMMIGLCYQRSAHFRKEAGQPKNKIREQVDAAVKAFDRAIEINDKYVDAYVLRGQVHLLIDKLDKTKADFEKAWTLDPRRKQELLLIIATHGSSSGPPNGGRNP